MEVTRMLSPTLDLDRLTNALPVTVQVRRSRSVPVPAVAAGAALAGALAAFLLDPQHGRRRRAEATGRLAGAARRIARRSERPGRYVQGVLEGTAERVQHTTLGGGRELDDKTLTDKVMSEVFGDADVPRGSIDVNSEHGVVVLRGEVGTPELIDSIERRVRGVGGVRDVRNLLHLPKTDATMDKGRRR